MLIGKLPEGCHTGFRALTFSQSHRQTTRLPHPMGNLPGLIRRAAVSGNRLYQNMTIDRVTYTLESSLDSVNQAEKSAEQFASKAGFDGDNCQTIGMAVREAVVNA